MVALLALSLVLLTTLYGLPGDWPAFNLPTSSAHADDLSHQSGLSDTVYTPVSTPSPAPAYRFVDWTFIDPVNGWALWQVTSGSGGDALRLSGTKDGGQTWHALTRPDQSTPGENPFKVSSIRFLDHLNGWVFGPGLFATHDGGKTWADARLPHPVVALAPHKKGVWALQQVPVQTAHATHYKYQLTISTNRGKVWQSAPTALPLPYDLGPGIALVRVGDLDAWIVYSDNLYPSFYNRALLIATEDGAKTWEVLPSSCRINAPMLRVTADASQLWFMCSHYRIGAQQKWLYLSSDKGHNWELVADSPGLMWSGSINNLSAPEYVHDLAVQDNDQAWIAYRHAGGDYQDMKQGYDIKRTTDGGRTWHKAAPELKDRGVTRLVFLDATYGWAAGEDALYRTTDGGATWKLASVLPFASTGGKDLPPSGHPPASSLFFLLAVIAVALLTAGYRMRLVGRIGAGAK